MAAAEARKNVVSAPENPENVELAKRIEELDQTAATAKANVKTLEAEYEWIKEDSKKIRPTVSSRLRPNWI